MSKRNAKPASVYAKEDAKLQAGNRKIYPDYDGDVIRFGRSVADFNAGFLSGDDNGREVVASAVIGVFQDLSARVKGKWSNKKRSSWNRAYKMLKEYDKRKS